MSKDIITDWDETAGNNTDIGGTGVGNATTIISIDDIIQKLMSQIAVALTTAAEFQANTAARILMVDKAWSAATTVGLTDAATIAVDMSTGINFTVTLAGNRTLGQPTNTKVGQAGFIKITQDGTGSRTLAYHADWKFAGGTDPTLTTTASAVDVLFYQVTGSNQIVASLVSNIS